MTVFIFQRINKLTTNWHPEGGTVVVANTLDRAVELLKRQAVEITQEEQDSAIGYETGDTEERVFVFPDSGCC